MKNIGERRISRRTALVGLGSTAGALAAPSILRAQSSATIRIGYVSPQTGQLGQFGETDAYALSWIRKYLANGLKIKDRTYQVQILDRDAQSNPNRAAELAGELIQNKEVHVIVPASTTDVTLPVSEQAELFGTPCISSTAPWQAVVMPRGGGKAPFQWTYHFFWGLEDIIGVYVNVWKSARSNRKVGLLLPKNADGEVWGDENIGFPPVLRKAGFEVIVPSKFEPRTNDFTAQISAFKEAGCEILGGLVYPGDLRTCVIQCSQQNFRPPIVTIAAGLLFPSAVEAIGSLGEGMSTEVWWTPSFPYPSSLTGESSAQIAAAWEGSTGKQWTQPLGYSHAIWEVILDTLKRAADPLDRAAIRDALKATDLQTLVGRVKFGEGPHPNVSKTPILGGQWVKGSKRPFDLKIVETSLYPIMKAEKTLEPLPWKA